LPYAKIARVRRFSILCALLLAALVLPNIAGAQSGSKLSLRFLQTESFPIVSGYLDARDSLGARITDLQAAELLVLEDGSPQPVDQLRVVQPGLRVIVVVNPAESFAIRDSKAITRYEYVKQALTAWSNNLSSTVTSLSLITPTGILADEAEASEWVPALESFQPDLGVLEVNAQTMSQALSLAAQPTTEAGMGTAIFWVTATPRPEGLTTLSEWGTALAELGVPLFIWQIDSPSNFESDAAISLQNLTQASGGQMFSFSGSETLPSPEDYFASLRSAYFFQYTSRVRNAGSHEVAVQFQREGANVTSLPVSFELDIRPPSPILVSPPSQIERAASQSDPQQLAPFSQPIEAVVEFSDGFERSLVRSSLFVDGEVVAENTAAPFNRFAWDLSSYDISQQVFLHVEVEDELGLVGTTIDFPVEISVVTPPNWFQVFLSRGAPTLALSIVIIAAGAFFLVMLLSGRLDPNKLVRPRRSRRAPVPVPDTDPLTDSPLAVEDTTQELSGQPFATPNAPAFLQRLSIQEASQSAQLLALEDGEVLIGSAKACNVVLKDESVEAQHARLTQYADGGYHLADLGSTAGTWVNYAPVSPEGSQLQDGDLVHIGRVAFRFLLNRSSNGSAEHSE
jgi:hypothetical protein